MRSLCLTDLFDLREKFEGATEERLDARREKAARTRMGELAHRLREACADPARFARLAKALENPDEALRRFR